MFGIQSTTLSKDNNMFSLKRRVNRKDILNTLRKELETAKASLPSFHQEMNQEVEAFCFGINHCIQVLESAFELKANK